MRLVIRCRPMLETSKPRKDLPMRINRTMLRGIIYIFIGLLMLYADFSLSSYGIAQHVQWELSHTIIWLCFLIGAVGIILSGFGVRLIVKAAK